jgi:hypothetical protein
MSGGNTVSFTSDDLCRLIVAKSSGSTTTLQFVKAVKLHKVEAWWPTSATNLRSVQLYFDDSTGANLKVESKSDIPLGGTDIGYASLIPLPNTTQSFWQSEGNAVPMFTCTASSTGALVLDIDVSLCLSDVNNPTSTGVITGTSGTNNSIGCVAPTNAVPVGYQPL